MYIVLEDMGSMPTTHDLEVSYAESFGEAQSLAMDLSLENDACYQIFEFTGKRVCMAEQPSFTHDPYDLDAYYSLQRGIDYPGTLF